MQAPPEGRRIIAAFGLLMTCRRRLQRFEGRGVRTRLEPTDSPRERRTPVAPGSVWISVAERQCQRQCPTSETPNARNLRYVFPVSALELEVGNSLRICEQRG